MRPTLSRVALGVAVCVGLVTPRAAAQAPCAAEGCEAILSVGDCMEDQFARALDASTVGYTYAVLWRGEPLMSGGRGLARPAETSGGALLPMTADTRMQIASASKPITAVALLHAMEERGLSPDTPLWTLLGATMPDVTPSSSVRALTIRQLLTHTSGYAFGYLATPRLDTTRALLQAEVPHAPGTYRYSNVNTSLARTALEAITGRDYESAVRELVGAPDMVLSADSTQVPYAYGFAGLAARGVPLALDFRDEGGAYGWYATAPELVQFLHGVRTNAYLTSAATREMLDGGMGWNRLRTVAGSAHGHEGQWILEGGRGIRSGVAILPEEVEAALLTSTNTLVSVSGTLRAAYDACSVEARSRTTRDGELWVRAVLPRHADRVRWTADGSDPTADSPVYEGGIIVPRSATVRLQGFWGAHPVTFVRTIAHEEDGP